jgi:cytochrome c oxidase assembly factor CtaG
VTWFLPYAVPLAGAAAAIAYARESRRRLYVVGSRRRRPGGRDAVFAGGLAVLITALSAPVDAFAGRLFWVHMGQVVAVTMVSAPLLVLSAPRTSLRRSVPPRRVGALGRLAGAAPLRALRSPVGAWLAFAVVLCGWHVPAAYGFGIGSGILAEQATLVGAAVLFWAQLIASPPAVRRLGRMGRLAYAQCGTVAVWALSVTLAYLPDPAYPVYSALRSRPGGISALADQQLGAGILLALGSLPLALVVFLEPYRWLGEEDEQSVRRERPRRRVAVGEA